MGDSYLDIRTEMVQLCSLAVLLCFLYLISIVIDTQDIAPSVASNFSTRPSNATTKVLHRHNNKREKNKGKQTN